MIIMPLTIFFFIHNYQAEVSWYNELYPRDELYPYYMVNKQHFFAIYSVDKLGHIISEPMSNQIQIRIIDNFLKESPNDVFLILTKINLLYETAQKTDAEELMNENIELLIYNFPLGKFTEHPFLLKSAINKANIISDIEPKRSLKITDSMIEYTMGSKSDKNLNLNSLVYSPNEYSELWKIKLEIISKLQIDEEEKMKMYLFETMRMMEIYDKKEFSNLKKDDSYNLIFNNALEKLEKYYLLHKEYDLLLKIYDKKLSENKYDSKFLFKKAVILKEMNELEKAKEMLELVIRLENENREAVNLLDEIKMKS